MGYTTRFEGEFKLNKKLDIDTYLRLKNEVCDYQDICYTGSDFVFGGYCQWVPNKDADAIIWDGGEKFYKYVEALKFLIESELAPKGYVLNGSVLWFGDDSTDTGTITVRDNLVYAAEKEFEVLMECPHCGENIYKEVSDDPEA